MTIEIIECTQNSPEWYAARLGLVTASCFKDILAKGKGLMRDTYMRKLAGEIATKRQMINFQSEAMKRGHDQEDEARKFYSMLTDHDPVQVGFVRNGQKGCSPDSLVDDNGLVEIKTKEPHLQMEQILKDEIPGANLAQLQGQLLVTEREWVDYVSYCPDMTLYVKRMHRDPKFIGNLKLEIDRFNSDLADMLEKYGAYKRSAAA